MNLSIKLNLPDALKQTLLFGTSIAIMKGVSLLMLPFIAHHLSAESFGRLEVITTLAVIGSILVGMGLEDTLFRFAGVLKDTNQRKCLAAEIFSLTLIIGSVAWLISWFVAETVAAWMPGNPTVYEVRLVLSILALEGCIAIPLGWLRMCNRAHTFFFVTTGRALLQAIVVVIQLSLDRGVEGILEAGLIAALAQVMVLGYLHIRDTGLRFSRQTGTRSFIYSLPIVGSGLVAFALNGLDRWILADYTSLIDVAHFGVAAKFALAVILLQQPYMMWWSPRRFEVLSGPNGETKAANFIALGVALTLIITVMVGLAAPLLISWLLPESYAQAGQYVVGLVLVMALKEVAELFSIGCFAGKTTGTQLVINTMGAGMGILGMLWWTPIYGVWGIIYGLMFARALRLLLFFIASQHLLPLPYPTRSILLLVMLAMGSLIMGSQTASEGEQLLVTVVGTGCLLGTAFLLRLIPLPERLFSQ